MAKKKKEFPWRQELLDRIIHNHPECIILKNDPNEIQGIPDVVILEGPTWVALETKRHEKAKRQPNQDYYVDKMNNMSYAAFASPENMEEVIDAVEQTFTAGRATCFSKR